MFQALVSYVLEDFVSIASILNHYRLEMLKKRASGYTNEVDDDYKTTCQVNSLQVCLESWWLRFRLPKLIVAL
jgi:hypothetical protein